MEPVRLTLATPVRVTENSDEIKELLLRRPLARDFKGMPGDLSQDDNMLMLSRISNVTLAAIEKLDAHDYLKACGVLQVFTRSGPVTGEKSSAS